MCFGDQDPLWDVHAPTFKVRDIYPPAANTSLDITLLKINGSESQRRTAIFSLGAFFRAYVGANANPNFAKMLIPSTPYVLLMMPFFLEINQKNYSLFRLPNNMTELGRQYFDNTQSIQLFNQIKNITGSSGIKITTLKNYTELQFPLFAVAYDNSSIPPPYFMFDPPKKGNLSLICLEQIENAYHINFNNNDNNEKSAVNILFNDMERRKITIIDIQLARRSSCWFTLSHSSTCAEPREMIIDILLETNTGYSSNTTVSFKSRYNLEFTRCNAMDFLPEKIAFLPVMFETVRISVPNNIQINGLKIISRNGGSIILSNIAGIIQQTSSASFYSISNYYIFSSLFFLSFFLF